MSEILKNFYVLEGLDGAGTTTQSKLIAAFLDQKKVPYFLTCEPTTSPIGTIARKILQGKIKTTPLSLAYQFCADRENHINNQETGIKVHLSKGEKVITDRYFFSSLAYQSLGVPFEKVAALNSFPFPEYILYLDTPPEVCYDRINGRGADKEIFEKVETLKQVKENYERAFKALDKNVKLIKIDGTLSKEKIFKEIQKYL